MRSNPDRKYAITKNQIMQIRLGYEILIYNNKSNKGTVDLYNNVYNNKIEKVYSKQCNSFIHFISFTLLFFTTNNVYI